MTWRGPWASAATAHDFVSWSTRTMPASAARTHAVRARGRVLPAASAAPFATGLALHALLRPRNDLEACDRDAITARDAYAVEAGRDALQGAVDVLDRLARGGRQRQVALAFHADGVALARLLVELRVALLALRRELLGRRLELLGLAGMARARFVEELAQLFERARGERRRELPGRRLLFDRRWLGCGLRRGRGLGGGLH